MNKPAVELSREARQAAAALVREGAARQAIGDDQAAIALYRRAFEIEPNEPNAMNLLGIIARQRGDLEAALTLSSRAVAASSPRAAASSTSDSASAPLTLGTTSPRGVAAAIPRFTDPA